MEKKINGMAIAGFVLSICSVPLLAAGFLCLIGVMLIPFLSVIFGEAAFLIAVFGVVLSSIGLYRSFDPETKGAGLSITGLLTGVMTVTLVLGFVALLIVDGCTSLALPRLL